MSLQLTSEKIYESVSRKNQIPPTAKQKLTDKYSDAVIKVYSLPFRTTLDSKLRELQYKILNNIFFTNEKLFHFGPFRNPLTVLFAMKNQNASSIYSSVVKCLLNF